MEVAVCKLEGGEECVRCEFEGCGEVKQEDNAVSNKRNALESSGRKKGWMCKTHRLRLYKINYKQKKMMMQDSAREATGQASHEKKSLTFQSSPTSSKIKTNSEKQLYDAAVGATDAAKMQLFQDMDVIAMVEYHQLQKRLKHQETVQHKASSTTSNPATSQTL